MPMKRCDGRWRTAVRLFPGDCLARHSILHVGHHNGEPQQPVAAPAQHLFTRLHADESDRASLAHCLSCYVHSICAARRPHRIQTGRSGWLGTHQDGEPRSCGRIRLDRYRRRASSQRSCARFTCSARRFGKSHTGRRANPLPLEPQAHKNDPAQQF